MLIATLTVTLNGTGLAGGQAEERAVSQAESTVRDVKLDLPEGSGDVIWEMGSH